MKKGEGMTDRFRQPEWKKQRQEQALREKFEGALPTRNSRKPGKASGWKWLGLAGLALVAWALWKALKLA